MITEKTVYMFFAIFVPFILINFNNTLGQIYIALMFADFIFYVLDKDVTYKVSSKNGIAMSVLLALGAYVLYMQVSNLLTAYLNPGTIYGTGLGAVLNLLATAMPALAGSKIITFIAWGVMVPIIETKLFFGRLMEAILDGMKATGKFDLLDIRIWIATIIVSAVFMVFHLTAKGTTNAPSLIITAFFGLVSCWLVLYEKSTMSAMILHIINNSIAVLYSLGILAAIIGGGI